MSAGEPAGADTFTGPDTEPPDAAAEIPWRRLSRRMLIVHPVRELINFLPALLVAAVAGAGTGQHWWSFALTGLGVAAGIARWFTTSYRVTPTRLEIHSGLFNKTELSTPLERIRSVDVESTALHRMLGLSVLRIGTAGAGAGASSARLQLNAVAGPDVEAVRGEILGAAVRLRATAAPAPASEPRGTGTEFGHWRRSWVRYAPFTATGITSIVAAAFFALHLLFFEGAYDKFPVIAETLDAVAASGWASVLVYGVGALAVVASAVAAGRYLIAYDGFSLSREDDGTLHIRGGMLTTRDVSLDETRLRGVDIGEGLALRLARGAGVAAIMTGGGREARRERGVLLPPGPAAEAYRVAERVLRDPSPLTAVLVRHGRRATRRRYTRALAALGGLAILAVLGVAAGLLDPTVFWVFAGLVPAGLLLAADRAATLGHAAPPGWVVTRHGSVTRRRSVIAIDGIVGTTVRRSYFQRRAGLATIVIATAAGRGRYLIPDLPEAMVAPLLETLMGAAWAPYRGDSPADQAMPAPAR